jgi:hypothetical protein
VWAIWTSSSRTRSKEPSLRYLCAAGCAARARPLQERPVAKPARRRLKARKELAALLAEILNEKITITENGRRRQITKRAAFIKQLVDPTPTFARARRGRFAVEPHAYHGAGIEHDDGRTDRSAGRRPVLRTAKANSS